ncbi:MAG: DUF1588 domain-containing protein [Verrucomicrobiaceae bacterium]|nr:DUF1588 domain-containing protein [Verrucomicrobiaceae bacterium]
MRFRPFILTSLGIFFLPATQFAAEPSFSAVAQPFLENYCLDCHDGETKKGGLSFEELTEVNTGNFSIWKSIWEQVALKEMPPRKKKNQPGAIDRRHVSQWILGEMEQLMKDKGGFDAHHRPAKANHLDHDLLFGKLPKDLEPASTPARIWRIHPQEHLVRLNELINKEPAYNPKTPGLRTRGDHIPWNNQGEVKVYYGLDRIKGQVGGSAAYAAAITGFSAILDTTGDHGLRSYPTLYSVNGAQASQIASRAEDIVRFMAYGPKIEPYQLTGKLPAKYKDVDIRGTIESLFYHEEVMRPLTPVYKLVQEENPSEEKLRSAVNYLFESLTFREPSQKESDTYLNILKKSVANLGLKDGVILGLTPIFLDRDALFRPELTEYGKPDKYGRVMLKGHELALAINSAFSYLKPDAELKKALKEGRLKTRDDIKREVTRILSDESIRKPRILQFFHEYFDYDLAGSVCKDAKALSKAGGGGKHPNVMFGMTASVDRLIELIVQEDKQVLKELLTTDRFILDPGSDLLYFSTREKLRKPPPQKKGEKKKAPSPEELGQIVLSKGQPIKIRIPAVKYTNGKVARTLVSIPREERMGVLTHPSWLVSHSDAMDNHAILRGKWIRERLLGGGIPDIPITVDAQLPDEPTNTLRERMRVTRVQECWRCHRKMDPLGLPFEMYNHLGLRRTTEQGKPVDTSGEIIDSGDPSLDGPVKNALEMIDKLAASERVEQVFVRHVFRFWMGRNETLEDAPALQAAHRAYKNNDGSMKALLTSIMTSDAFLYRKVDTKLSE